MPTPLWNRLYITCSFILIFMILSRLIWMQLRHYPHWPTLSSQISETYSKDQLGTRCQATPPEEPAVLEQRPTVFSSPWFSPGLAIQDRLLCQWSGQTLHQNPLQWQIPMVILTVMAAVWLARFLSSSWLLSLGVGATLLSRGALLARLGTLSPDIPVSLCLTLWLASLVHFLRTGTLLSLGVSSVALTLAALYEPLCLLIFLALPLFLLGCYLLGRSRFTSWFQEYQKHHKLSSGSPEPVKQDLLARGSLFRTLDVPFIFWIFHRRRWLKLALAKLFLFAVTASCLHLLFMDFPPNPKLLAEGQSLESSLSLLGFVAQVLPALLEPLDFHYLACIGLMFLCFFNAPLYGPLSLAECIWILGISGVLLLAGFWVKGFIQYKFLVQLAPQSLGQDLSNHLSSTKVFVWTEPIMLTLGIVCLYHLLKISGATSIVYKEKREKREKREKKAQSLLGFYSSTTTFRIFKRKG